MIYKKTNWTSTTPINTTNLNKIEEGIEQNSQDISGLRDGDNISFCCMISNSKETFDSNDLYPIPNMIVSTIKGEYTAENGEIIVRNTKYLELSGTICGLGNVMVLPSIVDENENRVNTPRFLQRTNSYFGVPIHTGIIELDPTKIYHVCLLVGGSAGVSFEMNNGFANSSTTITAKKIS